MRMEFPTRIFSYRPQQPSILSRYVLFSFSISRFCLLFLIRLSLPIAVSSTTLAFEKGSDERKRSFDFFYFSQSRRRSSLSCSSRGHVLAWARNIRHSFNFPNGSACARSMKDYEIEGAKESATIFFLLVLAVPACLTRFYPSCSFSCAIVACRVELPFFSLPRSGERNFST